jgi:RHS repeat-associated protein
VLPRVHPVTWPAAGSGTARLTELAPLSSSVGSGSSAEAGRLPVWIGAVPSPFAAPGASAPTLPAPASVRVRLASHVQAVSAGVNGVLMTLARADGGSGTDMVQARLRYAGIAGAYGGAWATRLRLVELPGCALTTPKRAACHTIHPLASTNDSATQTLSATVALNGAVVLAATSTAAGPEGNYAATSLNPDGTWAVQDGDFTYSYPISVPPSIGGSAPDVALTYDSQSIDGETSGQNTQASWIGDGWEYSPGFIERSYKSCANDGITNSGDECWGGNNATLSLGGHSGVLVRDDATGDWHLQGDDGSQVQLLTGASNGLWDGEYWLVTTTDGTKYYFGLNHLPGGTGSDAATNSAWGVPVYSPNSGDPCNSSSSGLASECQMGWRWNLDYVVDPHGNLQVYDYTPETNYYDMGAGQNNGNGTLTEYVRGGYLDSILYGYRLSDAIAGATPAAQVDFNTAQRCVSSSSYTCTSAGPTSATASNWPDVPYDQNCASTGTCTNYGPTFWSTVRLDSITTKVGSSTVDKYQLTQTFPDAGGASEPVMFLNSIIHTGEDGGSLALPPVTFTPVEIDNRVDGLVPAAPPLYRPRISDIATETGGSIAIQYEPPACSRVNNTMPSSADTNTMPCFPVYWTPPGESSPIEDWFKKSLVAQVDTADNTGIDSPVQVTTYQYLGGAAWHQDDSPVTDNTYRTWDQFRGYAQVVTETGASPDPVTETETTYMRGMNGDATASGGTKSVSVTDSLGDSIPDDNWLAGDVLETDTFTQAGGSVDEKTINGPWTYSQTASQAMPSGLPTMTAQILKTDETRSLSLLASGAWRDEQTNTAYNSSAQVIQTDHKGDGSVSDPETCTTTTYASSSANPMMLSYPDEVKTVTGACGTTATASNTDGDIRSFYDGSGTLASMGTFGTISGPGDITGTEMISGYGSSGSPDFEPESATTFDEYGRVLTSTDANGNVTTTAYTPATGALPTQTAVTNPMGWTTTTILDQGRQLPTQVTDENGRVTAETYDALGRLTAVWLPGRSQATQSADYTYSYSVTGTSPVVVTTDALRENGSYSTDIKIYDGLMQLRQEQTTTADNSAGRLVADTFHDSHGWIVKTSTPYYDSSTSPDTTVLVTPDDQVPSQTVTQYDGQGRVIASQFYSLGELQWQTTTAYPGADETDVTPPAGGTATSTFTNGLGETTASWSYDNSATPTGKASDADATSYTYDAAGHLASIADNSGNRWTYGYNLLGQEVSQSDPDTGTTTYTYDADGNMTASTDARGQTISYTYDALNRKTGEYSGTVSPANELASWTYDTLAKGQLTSSTEYVGGASGSPYTEAVTGYNTAYQPTGTSTTIPAAEGALAGTYTTSNTYTPNTGLLNSVTFSADGGLPAETVSYSYDIQGLLNAFGGSTAYLDQTQYTPLGQVQRSTTGVSGKQLVLTESYDEGTSRLLQTTTNLQTETTGAADVTNYTYNDAGALTSASDTQDTGQTELQCYQYDDLNRLTQAWTDTGGTTTAPAPSVSGIGGCTTTTPSESTVGGPASYWQTYAYDLLGDRTSEVQHEASGNISQTLSYPTNGTQPNAVSSVTTTSPSGTSTADYTYDAAGDTTGRSGQAALSLSYDPQGLTSSVTSSVGTSSYLYDADGSLLIERDPGTTTLYLDGGAEQLMLIGGAVSGDRFYAEPDGTTIVRSSSGTINYTIANQQGTATDSISASTLTETRRYYDPYGNPVGAAPNSWPDNLGFVGRPADPNTSLDLLGAREYDPVTGRFLQADPVLETGDPRQMGGYSYAADDPSSGSDPTGTSYGLPNPGSGACEMASCKHGGTSGYPDEGPTCPSGQHWDSSAGCVDNTITITGPTGHTVTKDADGSPCTDSGTDLSCASRYNLYWQEGYRGSRAISYQDMLAWAKQSTAGWTYLCAAFFLPNDGQECNLDPFSGVYRPLYQPPVGGWQTLKQMAGITSLVVCTAASAGACLVAIAGGISVDVADGATHNVPDGDIARDAAEVAIVSIFARAIDGAVDYEPPEEDVEAATEAGYEDPEEYTFGGAQMASVRAAAAFPENLFASTAIYRVFSDVNGQLAPDPSSPTVTVVGTGQ